MRRHSHSTQQYPASYYDDQLCLKPPFLLWVAVFYLSRAVTLPVLMALARFGGVDPRAIEVVKGLWSMDALAPSLIASIMFYVLCRRVPNASKPVRWLWAHGRIILSISALLDISLLSIGLLREGQIDDQSIASGFAALIDIYFLAYLWAARRIRDVFAEFPIALDAADAANSA